MPRLTGSQQRIRTLIVTLDGPAGSGKSTLARRLAAHYGWLYLDTGAMYRALALASIDAGITPDDGPRLTQLAESIELKLDTCDGGQRVWIGDRDVTQQIREPRVTERVSEVSAHASVRDVVVDQQRAYAAPGAGDSETGSGAPRGLVAEGRDMGTVVFPRAPLKFFLVATLDERARRRQRQNQQKGIEQSFDAVRAAIAERDRRDSSRDVAPLVPAEDALEVNTTGKTIDEVFEWMAEHIDDALAGGEGPSA